MDGDDGLMMKSDGMERQEVAKFRGWWFPARNGYIAPKPVTPMNLHIGGLWGIQQRHDALCIACFMLTALHLHSEPQRAARFLQLSR